jgi:polar amino acid transport system substrate-binding protein
VKDLAGKKCGVQAGSAMLAALPELEEMLKPSGGKMGEVVQYVSYPEAYQDLAIGRTDYVVNTVINLQSLVKDKPAIFELGEAVSKKIYIAWAVKKGNTDVKAVLDTFLLEQRKNGEMAKLQQKWFGTTFDMPEHYTTGT